jgi:methyl-accepting chemotaxis protein
MFAKLSIRFKIITVVAFLLVATTGMGLLAVKNMRAMNANTVDITTNWLPSVRVLGDLRAGVITYRNVIGEHMLCETLAEKQAMEKTLATVVESNTKIRRAIRADDHLAGRARALPAMVGTLGKVQEGHPGSHGAVSPGRRQGSDRGA